MPGLDIGEKGLNVDTVHDFFFVAISIFFLEVPASVVGTKTSAVGEIRDHML